MSNNKSLESRVERLERAVFGSGTSSTSPRVPRPKGGPTAGILALVDDGLFDAPKRKTLKETMTGLVKKGKDYSPQAVHIALQRLSRGKKAVLVKHKSRSGMTYVKRG